MIKLSKITAGAFIDKESRRNTPGRMTPIRANAKSIENLSLLGRNPECRDRNLKVAQSLHLEGLRPAGIPKTSDSLLIQPQQEPKSASVSIMELRLKDDKRRTERSDSMGSLATLLLRKGSTISKLRSRSGDLKPEPHSISHNGSRGSFYANDQLESRASVGNPGGPFFGGRSNESIYQSTNEIKVKPAELQEKIEQSVLLATKLLKDGVGNSKITSKASSCLLQFKFLLEKAYSKFLVFPDTDKEYVDGLLGIQTQVMSFIRETQKFLADFVIDKKNMEKQLKDKKDEFHKQLLVNEQLRNENAGALNDKTNLKKVESLLRAAKEHANQQENIWAVEKQQLKAQIEQLNIEVTKVQAQEYITELEKKYNLMHEVATNEVKRLNEDIEKKDTEVTKIEALLNRAISTVKEQREELDALRIKYEDISFEHREIKSKHDQYLISYNKYREIAQMSKEDLHQMTITNLRLAEATRQAEFRYFRMQNKFDLTRKEQADFAGFSPDEVAFDSQMLTEVKEVFQNAKYPVVTLRSQSTKEKNPLLAPPPTDASPLEKYSLFKPTFYSLINQQELQDSEKPTPDPADVRTVISREFIAVIRGIFDSKYHEIIYYDHHRQYSPFVDFVYSWMNSFHICPVKRRIRTITAHDNISVDKRRLEFYKFLMNPYVSKLWEVQAFKDFLEEKFSSDEIFFYLHCRQVLFKGPQLETLSAGLNVIHWIEFDRIETAMKSILPKLNEQEFEKLKTKLRARGRIHNKRVFLDSAFFFKVLLDFYRHEQIKKFELIKEDFMHMSKFQLRKKPQVPFNEFKQYIQVNFPFLSDLEKARLYRECWCLGNGIVDAESYLVVANENNLFLQGLKLLVFNNLPVVEGIEPSVAPIEKSIFMKSLEIKYDGMKEYIMKCQTLAEGFGVEEILANLSYKEKELLNAFGSQTSDNSDKEFFNVFTDFLHLMVKTRNQYLFAQKYIKGCEQDFLDNDAYALRSMMEPLKKYENIDSLEWTEKSKYALKIQNLFKQKKNQLVRNDGWSHRKNQNSTTSRNSNQKE